MGELGQDIFHAFRRQFIEFLNQASDDELGEILIPGVGLFFPGLVDFIDAVIHGAEHNCRQSCIPDYHAQAARAAFIDKGPAFATDTPASAPTAASKNCRSPSHSARRINVGVG